MKTLLKNSAILVMIVSLFTISFSSCSSSDDNSTPPADKTQLNALIASCETLVQNASPNDYPPAAITAFTAAINLAKQAAASTSITQEQVNALTENLTQAQNTFLASAYNAIPSTAMVFGLDFNIPNDVELTTSGARQLKAKLMTGPSEIFGANTAKPTFVDGVNGGKAIHFAQGAHLEIPEYTTSDFLTSTMSISVWVKPDSTREANYITSLNYWNNWKFQLQPQNKPFFTFATATGITDADNQADNSAPNGKWTHLVVTLDLPSNKLIFYVNGVATMTWDQGQKPYLTGSMAPAYSSSVGKLPLMIGAATTYAEALAVWTWGGWNTPGTWSYFGGSMDNLRYYNIALSSGQVSKLFNDEKAPQ